MISGEDDAAALAQKLDGADIRLTSPLAIWETAANVSRILVVEHERAQRLVERFLGEFKITVIAVEPEMTALALDAFRRYGKGRHPAALNFGDCFAYACAKHHKVPLLFKGNDFAQTDIETA
jgi:ribonuclease VapC